MNRRFSIILTIIVCFTVNAVGQTFTESLGKPNYKDAKVTVTHSKSIDDLVNGPAATQNAAKKTETTEKTSTTAATPTTSNTATASNSNSTSAEATKSEKTAKPKNTTEEESETDVTVDTRKKMLVGGRKVTGYRVQAYAGGNKRADRQNAEKAGNTIKRKYPDVPVYVHFYSPRWICRVGNYRTYEEAYQMLKNVKSLGFKQACIIKTKITVSY